MLNVFINWKRHFFFQNWIWWWIKDNPQLKIIIRIKILLQFNNGKEIKQIFHMTMHFEIIKNYNELKINII